MQFTTATALMALARLLTTTIAGPTLPLELRQTYPSQDSGQVCSRLNQGPCTDPAYPYYSCSYYLPGELISEPTYVYTCQRSTGGCCGHNGKRAGMADEMRARGIEAEI
jgi:hypothetical protein